MCQSIVRLTTSPLFLQDVSVDHKPLSVYVHKADGRVIIIASIDQAISVEINIFINIIFTQQGDRRLTVNSAGLDGPQEAMGRESACDIAARCESAADGLTLKPVKLRARTSTL